MPRPSDSDPRTRFLSELAKQRRTATDSTTFDLTDEGMVMGTGGYVSPEQVRAEEVEEETGQRRSKNDGLSEQVSRGATRSTPQ